MLVFYAGVELTAATHKFWWQEVLYTAVEALYTEAVCLAECNAKYKEKDARMLSLNHKAQDSLDDEPRCVECVHECAGSKVAQGSAPDGQPAATGCFIEEIVQQQRRGLSLHRVSVTMIERSCQAQEQTQADDSTRSASRDGAAHITPLAPLFCGIS